MNIVPYEVWSCGDYNNDSSIFTAPDGYIEISRECSANLEKSIKITKLTDDYAYITMNNNRFSCEPNKTYTVSIDVKLIHASCYMAFITLDSSLSEIQRRAITVPETNNQHCTISINASEDTSFVRLLLRLSGDEGSYILFDNISIITQ